MVWFFQAAYHLELQHNAEALDSYCALVRFFPNSSYIASQIATCHYNMRSFEESQHSFDEVRRNDPYKLASLDTYSNILYVTEESECCMRNCCPVNRALKLKVHNGPSKDYPVVQTIDRPSSCGPNCSWPCPCLRPQFTAVVRDPLYVVGSIDDPCHCCFKGQKVMGQGGAELFSVSGGICQWGLFFPCCAPVGFEARKAGTTVGGVERKTLECREMTVRTNRFIVDFGSISDPQERRMMLASAMLLDLEYFELPSQHVPG